jgi:glucokinase
VRYLIGLDLGGTAIKAGVVDEQWRIIARSSIPTEAHLGPEHVISRLGLIAQQVTQQAGLNWSAIDGVGVGCPGPCTEEGLVLAAPNLPGWTEIPLQKQLVRQMGVTVAVVNDANAAGYGEFIAGTGRIDPQIAHMILLTLGTGVGGGIIIDRKLLVGPHGNAAELGHLIVAINGRPCGCGQRGCLEQYASATGITREARRLIAAGQSSAMPAEPSAKDIFTHAQAGDALALAVVDDMCVHLAAGIITIIHSFDPQLVVLGGGVAAAGDWLLDRVRSHVGQAYWTMSKPFARIEAARLGNDAGFIGAAALAKLHL